jgi:hypothetical protein
VEAAGAVDLLRVSSLDGSWGADGGRLDELRRQALDPTSSLEADEADEALLLAERCARAVGPAVSVVSPPPPTTPHR